jgi:hypothetical protein
MLNKRLPQTELEYWKKIKALTDILQETRKKLFEGKIPNNKEIVRDLFSTEEYISQLIFWFLSMLYHLRFT